MSTNRLRLGISSLQADADALAYFAQLSPEPSNTFKNAVTALILQLKLDGNWSKLDRFWIHAAEYQQNARVSMVNPTSTQITEVNSPTWTANQGYTGDGLTSYLNTNFNPSVDGVNFLQDASFLGLYVRSGAGTAGCGIGLYDTAAARRSYIYPWYTDNKVYGACTSAAETNIAGGNAQGHTAIIRNSAAQIQYYKNAGSLGTKADTSAARANLNVFVCGLNLNGNYFAPVGFANQIALSYLGGQITNATFYAAIQQFATVIGFNV